MIRHCIQSILKTVASKITAIVECVCVCVCAVSDSPVKLTTQKRYYTYYRTYYKFSTGLLQVFYRVTTGLLQHNRHLLHVFIANFSRGGFENINFTNNF